MARLILIAALAIAAACGEGEADLCYAPGGFPAFVGRPPPVTGELGGLPGCAEPAIDPGGGEAVLCTDACDQVAECGAGDFAGCLDSCEDNPQCAAAFACLRDTECDALIAECGELLAECQ
jgi:hypothetical protein